MSVELSDALSVVAQTPIPASASASAATVIQVTQVNVHLPSGSPSPASPASPSPGEEEKDHLSPRQKEAIDQLYHVAKEAAQRIFSVGSLDHVVNIGRLLAEIVKLTEKATYRGEKIPGSEKKVIVLELGRQLLEDPAVISDELARTAAGMAYDAMGETLLETLVDVSKHVNVMIQEVAASCCSSFLACLQKSLDKK